jgi:AcrR family transcriptional regulator
MGRPPQADIINTVLDAAEAVVVRQGIANLTLDAVAADAKLSKGGLLHHFPNKDRLVEAMVERSAVGWRECYETAYENSPPGPGRLTRGLLAGCFTHSWTEQLKRSSSAVFAALAHNPSLIEPMRAAYTDLYKRIAEDDLPPGVGEAVAAAVDGLWLNWVLGLVPVDQALVRKVRTALESLLAVAEPSKRSPARIRTRRVVENKRSHSSKSSSKSSKRISRGRS